MGGMKSLLNKNLSYFLVCTSIVLLCCAPLFFYVMKYFYTEDLDELIIFRSNEFVEKRLPDFITKDITHWNLYNEDIQIESRKNFHSSGKVVQESIYNKSEGHEIDYRIYYQKIRIEGKEYILTSRIPLIEDKDLIGMLAGQYGIVFIVLLSSLLIIQKIISRKLWNPFYDSLSKIEKFNLEKEVKPDFKNTNIIEFHRLNQILTTLIDNDIKVFKQQKEFIENASHELQTPLAILQTRLDLLLQEPDLSQHQTEVIQSLYDVSSRLTRLNKNLLLLAKIDNNQFEKMETIDFNQVLSSQIDYLKEVAESEGIKLEMEILNPLEIKANKTLLEGLINNLVVNAIRYNIPNGIITITVQDSKFTIKNTGEEKSLDQEKIFNRFRRNNENKKGNGLGLSIVNQIVKFHNWNIKYAYYNTIHQFTVSFR